MQPDRIKRIRRTEVLAGLIIILVAFSYIASLLLDFNFLSPDTTLQEDLAYLSEHTRNQKISSWAWLFTAAITLSAIPFYLIIFHRRMRSLHYINGLFMIGAAAGFTLMGIKGLELHQSMILLLSEGIEQANEQIKLSLLDQFRQELLFRRLGSSCVGLFALGLSLTKFRLGRFPLFSTGLLLISGPALIFFNWYDPDHLARTGAMAGIMIGVVVFCVRLINKGLTIADQAGQEEIEEAGTTP
jgi:hypothetical protein